MKQIHHCLLELTHLKMYDPVHTVAAISIRRPWITIMKKSYHAQFLHHRLGYSVGILGRKALKLRFR